MIRTTMGITSDMLVRLRSLAGVRSYNGSTVGNVNQGGKRKPQNFLAAGKTRGPTENGGKEV
jgi:hypothetical protein